MSKSNFLKEVLRNGEQYAGLLLGAAGEPDHHIILLPGESKKGAWSDGMKWAESVGGVLPSRREQRILFANAKQHFEEAAYWSGEQHAAYSDYAWSQYFDNGHQHDDYKSASLRARAVRRLVIQ